MTQVEKEEAAMVYSKATSTTNETSNRETVAFVGTPTQFQQWTTLPLRSSQCSAQGTIPGVLECAHFPMPPIRTQLL